MTFCAEGKTRVILVFICRHGRHRSVGMARIARYLLHKETLEMQGPTHLSKYTWGKICDGTKCSECASGDGMDIRKRLALQLARRIWNDL